MIYSIRKWIQAALTPVNTAPVSFRDLWQEPNFTAEQILDYCEVIDNRAETTIVCFAGLALGFAGLPSFEFRKSLGVTGEDFNLLFVRDIRRFWYHLAPDGTPHGLNFYAQAVQTLSQQLGTRYLVTLGVSAGGYAALYFGWRLGAHRIIAFSPQTNLIVSLQSTLPQLLGFDRIWLHPRQYLREELMVGLALRRRSKLLSQQLEFTHWGDLSQIHSQNPNPQTQTHLYYCQHNHLDRQQAIWLQGWTRTHVHACDCDLHNVAGYLRDRDQLFSVIMSHLSEMNQIES
jgi:pimeloyl-ACP methyl ester carboxylesterase